MLRLAGSTRELGGASAETVGIREAVDTESSFSDQFVTFVYIHGDE